MPFRSTLAIRYAVFAILATLFNLGAQSVCLRVYDGPSKLGASIIVGTGVGFLAKYLLDKHYIFFNRNDSVARELGMVALYGLTAVATTLVFWAFELGCWMIWETSIAKYCGAAIGLGLGYLAKYLLDSRFVFAKALAA